MNAMKVVIDNWPSDGWFKTWIPLMVAIIAIVVSVFSIYFTQRNFIRSARPFVWATSYGVIDNDRKTIIPVPSKILFRVKNSPAKIVRLNVRVSLNKDILLFHEDKDIVRFPDESSEWSFNIGKKEFEEIMNRSSEDKAKLIRTIEIKYSSLDGGKEYQYKLQQSFEPLDGNWRDIYAEAN